MAALFICCIGGQMFLPAALAAPVSQPLFGPANGFRLSFAEPRGLLLAVAGGKLQITANEPAEDRRILLPLADREQDLSAYRYVEAKITNRSDRPLIFTFWALSGNGWGGGSTFPVTANERETLAPGASGKYRVDLEARYPGDNVYTTAVNPAKIRWLAIACEEHQSPIAFSVGEISATGNGRGFHQDISRRIQVPDVTRQAPGPGRRVYQQLPGWENTAVSHVLTLPRNWTAGRKYPVIVEYTGNRFFDKFCYSTGRTDQGNLAYGLSRGEDYICLNLPFISPDGGHEQIDGWGDIAKDVDYCLSALKLVCDDFGGDRRAIFFTGFSRGASAGNYLALANDRIAAVWCGFVTEIDPGMTWPAGHGPGWRHMDIGWNDRAARIGERPWYYQPPGFGPDVHVDVEFLEDRPSTIATRRWMQAVIAARLAEPGAAAPPSSHPGRPQNLFIPPCTETEQTITLMWEKPAVYADIVDYLVFCDGRQIRATSKTNLTVGDLAPNRRHSFLIRARNAAGVVSSPSNAIAANTLPAGKRINILDYGAAGNGRKKSTTAIQRAIDACPVGGTVEVPAGIFLTGALFLKSDLTLLIDRGGVLQGTADLADYQPSIRNRFEGWEMDTFASLINAGRLDHAGPPNVRNITIRGAGEIRGGGAPLADAMIAAAGLRSRGRLICIMNCDGLNIQGLVIDGSPSWTIQYIYSRNISCHDLTIRSTVNNGDGMDPDSSTDCYIFNCSFATGDDCIAIKSGKNPEGWSIARPARNIRITDCVFLAGHGISIGSEISGGVSRVLIRDCKAGDLLEGLQIKGTKARGGVVEDVRVQDCTLGKIRILTKLDYNNDGAPAPRPPYFRNFAFINLDLRQAGASEPVIILNGFAESGHRTENVLFENLRLPAGARIDVDQSSRVKFIRVRTIAGAKPAYQITNSQAVCD